MYIYITTTFCCRDCHQVSQNFVTVRKRASGWYHDTNSKLEGEAPETILNNFADNTFLQMIGILSLLQSTYFLNANNEINNFIIHSKSSSCN